MRYKNILIFFSILVSTLIIAPNVSVAQKKSFPIYDALLYKNKPDLTQDGFESIEMLYAGMLWKGNEKRDNPNREKIIEVAKKIAPNSLICIDIEHWPVKGTEKEVKENLEKYKIVAKLIRENTKNSIIGFYGLIPIRDYWRALSAKDSKKYLQWKKENRSVEGILEYVDVLFPSLYTFYPNYNKWEEYAIENIKEAKKHGKPIYVFLWPKYHDSTKLKGVNIPPVFWRLQLDTSYKYADGIVIWGGWKKEWDKNFSWWIETKKAIKSFR